MCTMNVSVHLNRGRGNNDKEVIKVYNFSARVCKQQLIHIADYITHMILSAFMPVII